MWKKRITHCVLLVLWLAYALLVAEVAVRILAPQPLIPRYITGTAWGVRGNIPNARYRHKTPEVSVGYRINGQGMRADREYARTAEPGVCRIALFGDSYFMGYELDYENTIANVLEREIRAAGIDAEVLNFSVSGFGTAEMILAYRGQAREFHPDVVVMEWHETDLDDNVRSNLFALKGGGVEQISDRYLPSVSVQDFLMRFAIYRFIADNSHFYSVIRERTAAAVKRLLVEMSSHRSASGKEPAEEPSGGHAEAGSAVDYETLLSTKLVEEFRREAAADGADFTVVDIPTPEGRTKLTSTWARLGNPSLGGAPVVLGAEVFAPILSKDTKLYFERGHNHLTPIAASTLATAMARSIEELLKSRDCSRSR